MGVREKRSRFASRFHGSFFRAAAAAADCRCCAGEASWLALLPQPIRRRTSDSMADKDPAFPSTPLLLVLLIRRAGGRLPGPVVGLTADTKRFALRAAHPWISSQLALLARRPSCVAHAPKLRVD